MSTLQLVGLEKLPEAVAASVLGGIHTACTSVFAKIVAAFPIVGTDQACSDAFNAIARAYAEAICEELTANAVVVPTLLVAPPGGGPVTGTGSVT